MQVKDTEKMRVGPVFLTHTVYTSNNSKNTTFIITAFDVQHQMLYKTTNINPSQVNNITNMFNRV